MRVALTVVLVWAAAVTAAGQTLDEELRRANPAELAALARREGDAARGGILFFQAHMACSKCHSVGEGKFLGLGPDLTKIEKTTSDESLVESVLLPSKVIRKGYEPVVIVLADGRTASGFLEKSKKGEFTFRDVARGGEATTLKLDEIEGVKPSDVSIMPAGQVNQLASRQQFLDLIRYLIEIRDGGAARARALQPSPALLTLALPEYEARIDHRGFIRDWNAESLKRGEAIYRRVCANCHGTLDQPGSLPTSLRFGEGKFKNGSDPLAMYQTLTRGFGLMAAQTWMVPSQKYDVIHYIRETYLGPHNRTQFVTIDDLLLSKLPSGDTRGPEPRRIEPWSAMDYGPHLTHTFEIPAGTIAQKGGQTPSITDPLKAGAQGDRGSDPVFVPNIAYKGIAIRLDPGAGGVARGRHWMVFDSDTLRMAGAWSVTGETGAKTSAGKSAEGENFIDWRDVQFNGEHNVHPHAVGRVAFANGAGPGWANPEESSGRGVSNKGDRHLAKSETSSGLETVLGASPLFQRAERAFRDTERVEGRDGRRYGPLPRKWGRFRGVYHHGQEVVLSYTIGNTPVLESPGLIAPDSLSVLKIGTGTSPRRDFSKESAGQARSQSHFQPADSLSGPVMLRRFNIGARDKELVLQVADHAGAARAVEELKQAKDGSVRSAPLRLFLKGDTATASHHPLEVGIAPADVPVEWRANDGHLRLRIPAGKEPLRFAIWTARYDDVAPGGPANEAGAKPLERVVAPLLTAEELDMAPLTRGGPARWTEKLTTRATIGAEDSPFAVDVLTAPETNPWLAQTRFTGLDFLPDGRIAVCSWDGDVWLVEQVPGRAGAGAELRWQRIASGMFQPLGLKVVGKKIHVTCRDQLAVLHDLNGDGEIDFYECLNNDHQVTDHFHEFAMGLQTDSAGNFYYAKSARHALPALVPHHGTLLRVSRDGSKTEILANGFRAANGVCLNPDGSFVVTDQEGHWNPKNRINWVTIDPDGPPKFYGNMLGYSAVTDSSDSAMEPPLCWITNAFDRSPAELLWVDSPRWGALNGALLNLSYGYGKVFVVPHEKVDGVMQGGMVQLPIPVFPTGVMRGRFSHGDGHLYLCGMFSWAGSATHPGGLYRLRATGRPVHLPVGLHATKSGIELVFTEPLDPASLDAKHVQVKTWSLKRTAKYGSDHYDEKSLDVRGAHLSADGLTLSVDIPDIQPTWCMEIVYALRAADGTPVQGTMHNTVHRLGK